jgi:dephospho-CoA kinase
MQAVNDSVAREHLEQLIATDAHLQQLVQRIVHAEVETAMYSSTEDSTANYLNF